MRKLRLRGVTLPPVSQPTRAPCPALLWDPTCAPLVSPFLCLICPPTSTIPAASAKLCSVPTLRLCSCSCSNRALDVSQIQIPKPCLGPLFILQKST